MGGCCSVTLSCDQFVNQVTQYLCVHASYIHTIEKNLTALEKSMEELKARRDDLLRRVEREENRGLQRLSQIQVWLSRVETIESQVNDLFSGKTNELQRLCICGFCSKNLKLSYHYGKQVFAELEEVENLKSNGVFEVVAEQAQASHVVERPIQPKIVGHETMLETAWNHFMKNDVGLLGLHGMGGVGKTTLLKQINNKIKENAFDVVIWVVVSKDLQIQKIQEEVAKKLGLNGEDWNRKDEDQKACEIHNVLRKKNFVLLLDDIWAKVDLTKIGVPFPNRANGSKVVFTTRSKEVCGRMGVDAQMEVQCLSPEDALDLFQKKVGDVTLGSHADIPELANVVAQKCYGLPLALNVIGEAMSCKQTIQEWHHAINILNSNATAFSGMEDEVFPILKYSYDNLKGEQLKSCLLYCALFPEDDRTSKDDLIEYWICEEIIDDSGGMENAENQGYEIIGSLVRSSLLMEEDKLKVYMHDVVREMALWIASDFGKQKDNFIVHAGGGLCEMPKFKNWNIVKRMSLMANKINHISGSLECCQLTTLFLQRNMTTLCKISGEFFKSMPKLVVLDLAYNKFLTELPDGISELVSLKYLNVSETRIQCLPVGLQKLKHLIHLDLEGTTQLLSVVGISALLNLKVLKLYDSGVKYSSKTNEQLKVLDHLEILTIGIESDSSLNEFLSSHKLMCCTQVLDIKGCQLESSDIWCLATMKKVRVLHLRECTISEVKMCIASNTRETVSLLQNPGNAFFLSLSKIHLWFCKSPKELTWLMLVPNLTVLTIVLEDNQLGEIINKEKARKSEESGIVPFQKLEILQLYKLPELQNIYWRPLPFPCLKRLDVSYCPKLRKLPLNSKSGDKRLIVKVEKELNEAPLKWEDEATKSRFLSSSHMIE